LPERCLLETLVIASLIIVGAIVIYYASRLLSSTIGIITKILLLLIVVLALITVLVYNDLDQLKKDIVSGENTFIVREGKSTYSAVGFRPISNSTFDMNSFKYYLQDEIADMDQRLDDDEQPDLNSSRVFILSPLILNKSYTFEFGVDLSQDDILQIIMSNDSYGTLSQIFSPEMNISKESLEKVYGDEGKLKGFLSAAIIINYFQHQDMKIAQQVKSGEFKVIPETISFKVIKYIPFLGIM
jgi:hypothetical protein